MDAFPASASPKHAFPDSALPGHAAGNGAAPTSVLVLGGAGFVGRHVAAALRGRGCRVVVGTRHPARRRRKGEDVYEYRRVRFERMRAQDWSAVLEGCDAVVNCVGILRERGRETYHRVHARAPEALAAACRAHGRRLVHVSALGLENDLHSGFLRSKRAGEAALRASGADWHIVRPSLLDGEGGFGARWVRRVARWPVHPLPVDAVGRLAVLDVGDLGEAVARLALDPPADGIREHELGGPQARTLTAHLAAMRALHTPKRAIAFAIPAWLARLVAHGCDLLHWTPYSYGHLELLRHDNCPYDNRLSLLLGRMPRSVGAMPAAIPVPAARPVLEAP